MNHYSDADSGGGTALKLLFFITHIFHLQHYSNINFHNKFIFNFLTLQSLLVRNLAYRHTVLKKYHLLFGSREHKRK